MHVEMEHLGEVDAALRMVAPDEGGAMDVLKGVQVGASHQLCLRSVTSQCSRLFHSAPQDTFPSGKP